jgi:hypothetical protein
MAGQHAQRTRGAPGAFHRPLPVAHEPTPNSDPTDEDYRTLDAAVAAAYGWPADLPDDDVLSRLLELNLSRSAAAPDATA